MMMAHGGRPWYFEYVNYFYKNIQLELDNPVDSLFTLKRNKDHSVYKNLIVPDCTPGLMFIKRGYFYRRLSGNSMKLEEGKLYLFGQKTRFVEYEFSKVDFEAIGCKLMPQSFFELFRIPADSMTNKVIELDLDMFKAFKCVNWEDALLMDLASAKCRDSLIDSILEEIHCKKGDSSIKEISLKFGVGYKKIERLFKRHVGLTPKFYMRIIRFNNSIRYGMTRAGKLTDIAFQSGYFDQNHYIKETKEFSGLVPSEVFKLSENLIEPSHVEYLAQRHY